MSPPGSQSSGPEFADDIGFGAAHPVRHEPIGRRNSRTSGEYGTGHSAAAGGEAASAPLALLGLIAPGAATGLGGGSAQPP